jgi:hypothetical protein
MNQVYLKVGNTEFNLQNLKDFTKDQFIETYTRILNIDVNEAWKIIQKELGNNGSTKELSEESGKNKRKRVNENASNVSGLQGENNLPEHTGTIVPEGN